MPDRARFWRRPAPVRPAGRQGGVRSPENGGRARLLGARAAGSGGVGCTEQTAITCGSKPLIFDRRKRRDDRGLSLSLAVRRESSDRAMALIEGGRAALCRLALHAGTVGDSHRKDRGLAPLPLDSRNIGPVAQRK